MTTTYVDASVVLRGLLGENGRRPDWSRLGDGITSAVTRIECQRSLLRHAFRGRITQEFAAERRIELLRILRSFDEVALDDRILDAAGEAFPGPLGTLDAIHMATAVACRYELGDLRFATHDDELGRTARAMGFDLV